MIPLNHPETYQSLQQNFIAKLSSLMSQRSISIADLARQLDLGETTIGHWLNGHAVPSLTTAALIANRFGVTIDSLISKE